MKILVRSLIVAALFFCQMPLAFAWGSRTQLTIVSAAVRLVSRDGSIPLARLDHEIQRGASAERPPYLVTANAVNTIESEMYLLQAMRSRRIDPYYAYRLGALGRLVSVLSQDLPVAFASGLLELPRVQEWLSSHDAA